VCECNLLFLCLFVFSDGNVLQFENGYVVETVVEGNEIGVIPYRIRVSEEDGELFAVDEINSNIVRITPPLSQCMAILLFVLLSLYNNDYVSHNSINR